MKHKLMVFGIVGWTVALTLGVLYSKKKLNIFHPQMKPSAGDWGSPVHRVGEKPLDTWSKTTFESAVDKKPLEGKVVTREGEIIDVSCYTQLGKHGADHAGCAKACILNGQPMGLLEDTGTIYLLIPEEHNPRRDGKTSLREALIHHVAQIVQVTGTYTNVNGTKTIFVHGFVKKE
ncbi:MAG: hypothetical protein A3B70_04525 [Deltaproteobacteria bacterium RIFCSPHIGHO2_02_FULL_40_11]|nr:MAG: hypothetical protein A3B70_04525 [Deltaproteobacteria bacterium RIFCSPHIGHO2_02_FULL_40_11]